MILTFANFKQIGESTGIFDPIELLHLWRKIQEFFKQTQGEWTRYLADERYKVNKLADIFWKKILKSAEKLCGLDISYRSYD